MFDGGPADSKRSGGPNYLTVKLKALNSIR